MKQQPSEQFIGVAVSVSAYILWGFLPIYWKFMGDISAGEVLAHRIVWSLIFVFVVLGIMRKLKSGYAEFKALIVDRKQLLAISLASFFISINWFTFIWAVSNDHMVETSLGYYINPLISVLLGIFFLKERLNLWQTISFCLAAIGVINLILNFGVVPWVAFILAISFAFYGLCKKLVRLGAMVGLAIETLMITPIALIYIFYIHIEIGGSFASSLGDTALLIGAGAATAIPLLLFASGVRRISLSLIGFLQYIAPTIMLILGVFVYKETFTSAHLLSFVFIWIALAIFSLARTRIFSRIDAKLLKKKAV